MIIRKITTEDRMRAIERLSQRDFFVSLPSPHRVDENVNRGIDGGVNGAERWEQPIFAGEEAATAHDPVPQELQAEQTHLSRPLVRIGRFVIYRTSKM